MASVKGIGGVFIDSQDAEKLATWYQQILGIEMEAHPDGIGYYHVFSTRDPDSSILRENPVFAINKAEKILAQTGRGFVLNLRVDNLDKFLEQIHLEGVSVDGKILVWERGKHARIRDLDGNIIELYEEILLDSDD